MLYFIFVPLCRTGPVCAVCGSFFQLCLVDVSERLYRAVVNVTEVTAQGVAGHPGVCAQFL